MDGGVAPHVLEKRCGPRLLCANYEKTDIRHAKPGIPAITKKLSPARSEMDRAAAVVRRRLPDPLARASSDIEHTTWMKDRWWTRSLSRWRVLDSGLIGWAVHRQTRHDTCGRLAVARARRPSTHRTTLSSVPFAGT